MLYFLTVMGPLGWSARRYRSSTPPFLMVVVMLLLDAPLLLPVLPPAFLEGEPSPSPSLRLRAGGLYPLPGWLHCVSELKKRRVLRESVLGDTATPVAFWQFISFKVLFTISCKFKRFFLLFFWFLF